jgi:pyruvate dehydrogenase E1 component alpha subunit
MDVLEVRKAAQSAIGHVRSGEGPFFLEVITYRFRGHSMGDPERYRRSDEVKKWQENDPIGIYRRYLIDQGVATDAELDTWDLRVEQEVLDAVQAASSAPEPGAETLFEHIYFEG